MIRSFITDPLSDIRHPDGAIDPRQGGADMNPQELKTEGVILDLLPLNSMHVSEHLVRKWIAPWHTMMYSFLRRAFRRKVINDVLNNFGPQVASYFKFLDYYTLSLMIPSVFGIFAQVAERPTHDERYHVVWRFVQPSFACFIVLWGAWFCSVWPSKVSDMAFHWQNGALEKGAELQAKGVLDKASVVRPEFALRFRKDLQEATAEQLEYMLSTIRHVLRLDEAFQEDEPHAFNDRALKHDIESFSQACYISRTWRMYKSVVSNLMTLAFVSLSCLSTYMSMSYLDEELKEESHIKEPKSLIALPKFHHAYVYSGLFSCISIQVLKTVHREVVQWSTEWQQLRYESDYESAIFNKLFAFEFFNSYNSLLWIAFVRRNMDYLAVQVYFIMAMSGLGGNLLEVLVPKFFRHIEQVRQVVAGELVLEPKNGARFGLFKHVQPVHNIDSSSGGAIHMTLVEATNQVACGDDVFKVVEELLELVIQFGMVTMFALAAPLAPLVAICSCCLEMRIDAYKLVIAQRIPDPRMCVGIGMTHYALVIISYLAVIMNCALLMLTTYNINGTKKSALDVMLGTFGETSSSERFAILVVTEHVIMCMMYLISLRNPVSETMLQEQYRQEFYENREAVICRQDQEDAVNLAAVRRRARRGGSSPEENNNNNAKGATLSTEWTSPGSMHQTIGF